MRDIRILSVVDNQPDVDLLKDHPALVTEANYTITHVDFTQFFDVVKSIESFWLTVVKLHAASCIS